MSWISELQSRASYDEAIPQHYRDDTAISNIQHDPRRRYPLRVHNPANVIVLD